MTDDQFEKMIDRMEDRRTENLKAVIQAILPAREDRDRLIRMEGQIELATKLMSMTRAEDLVKIENADNKAAAAHRRLDSQFKWTVGTVIITVGGMILTALFAYMKMGGKVNV